MTIRPALFPIQIHDEFHHAPLDPSPQPNSRTQWDPKGTHPDPKRTQKDPKGPLWDLLGTRLGPCFSSSSCSTNYTIPSKTMICESSPLHNTFFRPIRPSPRFLARPEIRHSNLKFDSSFGFRVSDLTHLSPSPLTHQSSSASLTLTRSRHAPIIHSPRCPHRLVAQDIWFSARGQGFDSPWGYCKSRRCNGL